MARLSNYMPEAGTVISLDEPDLQWTGSARGWWPRDPRPGSRVVMKDGSGWYDWNARQWVIGEGGGGGQQTTAMVPYGGGQQLAPMGYVPPGYVPPGGGAGLRIDFSSIVTALPSLFDAYADLPAIEYKDAAGAYLSQDVIVRNIARFETALAERSQSIAKWRVWGELLATALKSGFIRVGG